jgi:hypothetical protein
MNEQQERALTAGLRALAATTRNASADPRVEAAVLAEMRRVVKPAVISRGWRPLAAALVLASTTGVWLAQKAAQPAATQTQMGGFVAVPGAAALPPMESGAIVRVALHLTELPAYGIQIVPEMTTDSVDADLLIAQDGLARGIRLVNDSQTSRSTP